MKTLEQLRIAVVICLVLARAVSAPAAVPGDWQAICQGLKTYTHGAGNDAGLLALERYLQRAKPEELTSIEESLVALLRDPQVSADAKRFICRQGAALRSPPAVAALVALQADESFSFMACFALQRMPTDAALAALRERVSKGTPRQQVDVIRALAARGDQGAVPLLAAALRHTDKTVALAAAPALGRIGGTEAEGVLAAFAPAASGELRTAVAEARLCVAPGLTPPQAAAVYRAYVQAPEPTLRMAAFAGLLAAEPDQRLNRILEAIQGQDSAVKSVALHQARGGGDAQWTQRLAGVLGPLSPPDQAAVLDVLQSRGHAEALPDVLALLASPDVRVRIAAIKAAGRLEGTGQLERLVTIAAEDKDAIQSAARDAVACLRGKGVDEQLMRMAEQGPAVVRAEALAALTARGAPVVPLLIRSLDAAEPAVRTAARSGLRTLAGPAEYPELLRRSLAPGGGAVAQGLRDVVIAIYRRSDNPDACVAQLRAAFPSATAEGKGWLLGIFGSLGDPQGLDLLRQSLASNEVQLRKDALVALASWPDATPVKDLVPVLDTAADPPSRLLALRASATLVGRDQKMPNPSRVKQLRELLERASRSEEKRLVIAQLSAIRCPASLALAVELLADAQVADEAAAAVVALGQQFQQAGIPAADLQTALEKVIQSAQARAVSDRARQQLQALRGAGR